ncbi:hypothetical protein RAA17_08015 [Komagataeibacter rhaeticus]|nr:hypothetical protein [Komagataeibacter rhaeticus]
MLARALLAQGHPQAACAAIRLACQRQPGHVPTYLACAEIMEATGAVQEAARAFAQAARLAGRGNVPVRRLHAGFLWRRGRRAAAIAQMRHVMNLAPRDAVMAHELAEMLLAHDDRAGAETVLRMIVARHPADARACALLGALVFARGRMGDAADLLRRAVARMPEAESCNNLGLALMALGDMAGADAALCAALRLAPMMHGLPSTTRPACLKVARYARPAPDMKPCWRANPALMAIPWPVPASIWVSALLARGDLARGWALWGIPAGVHAAASGHDPPAAVGRAGIARRAQAAGAYGAGAGGWGALPALRAACGMQGAGRAACARRHGQAGGHAGSGG